MPELPVKEVRMPELRLPEIDRAEITRSLSDMHMPEFDLSRIDRPKMPDRMAKVDLGKAVAGVVAMTPFRPKRSRPRWPLAVGGIVVAGVVTAAVLSNRAIRDRIANAIEALRARIAAMRQDDMLEVDVDDPVAFTAADTAMIDEPLPYADGTTADVTGYPDGLGADAHVNGAPKLEESGVRD
jgi:hypothetical protein